MLASLESVGGQVLGRVVVAAQQVEAVPVDSDVATDGQVGWRDVLVVPVHVLVLESLQEWALYEAGVLLRWFEHRDCVVSEIERNDESPVHIFGDLCVESCRVSQDFAVVVYVFEEVNLGLLGNQVEHEAERVDLVSETVVGWDDAFHWLSWFGLLDVTDWEVSVELLVEVLLREAVHATDLEGSSIGHKVLAVLDLVASQVPVTNEVLAWLVHTEGLRQFLSSQVDREGVSAVVGEVDLPDLDGVISQEVVPDVLQVLAQHEESQHFSVVVEELLLGGNLATAKLLLQELEHLLVLLAGHWLLGLGKCIVWHLQGGWLRAVEVVEEFSSVLVAVVNADLTAT